MGLQAAPPRGQKPVAILATAIAALATVPLWIVAGLAAGNESTPPWAVAGALAGLWTIGAPLLARQRVFQHASLRKAVHARMPNEVERKALGAVFRRVCAHAGVDPGAFVLMVSDDDAMLGLTTPTGVIVVHRALVDEPGNHPALAAVLAHEVGHHQADHFAILAVYLMPYLLIEGTLLPTRWRPSLRTKDGRDTLKARLMWGVALAAFTLGTALVVWLALNVQQILKRRDERCADAFAADIGYADELRDLLLVLTGLEAPEPMWLLGVLPVFDEHPPPTRRLAALPVPPASPAPLRPLA